MDAAKINKALYSHFANYEYKLNNTFVFAWESDFFAMSKSGYFIECEVKISRSDYLRDFAKEKHGMFKAVHGKRSHHIYRHGEGQGDCLGRVRTGQLYTQWGEFGRYHHSRYKDNPDNWNYDWKRRQYIVNDYGHSEIRWRDEWVYSPASHIQIVPVEKLKVPHQFYFTCPEGLIEVSELPPYAGLITVREDLYGHTAKVVKRAPYLHKRDMDLRTELLKKYYNLWQYKVSHEEKARIRGSYSEKEEEA